MRSDGIGRWSVPAIALTAFLLRLPYLGAPAGSDEAGYLTIARQWHGAGPSLYGRYWVDRPPLLITLFQLAGAGLPAVRLLGALAAAVAVLGIAAAARTAVGQRAAVVSAVVAAGLFASPQLGVIQVNGELLAAPFVAWSIALGLAAVQAGADSRAAFGAGVLACAALLVKQNMAEPVIFDVVAGVVAWRTGIIPTSQLLRIARNATVGALVTLAVTCAWTLAHGTSLSGVFDALYPFRIRAAHLVATFPDVGLNHRRSLFVAAVIHSGVLLAPVVLVWAFARRRASPVVFWGLAATFAWTTASIVAGGGFWDHYLVEAVVPVAIMAGVAAGVRRGWSILLPAVAGAVIVTVALTHWVQGLDDTTSSSGTSIGTAIAAVARPGDTLTNLFGSADATEAAGLSSPYPYLWTLPAQVDDPQLSRLEGLLRGSKAPTWIVDWGRPSFPAPVLQQLRNDVEARYHQVAVICGRTVYLRDGLDRSVPAGRSCRGKDADAGGAVTQTPPAVTTASVAKPAISPMSRP